MFILVVDQYRILDKNICICLENTLAQLIVAKNTNIELIKRYEEKKLEEHKYIFCFISEQFKLFYRL